MTRLAAIAAAALTLALAGCATGEPDPTTGEKTNLDVRRVQVDDRIVTCIVYRAGYAGGLSCDWNSPTQPRKAQP